MASFIIGYLIIINILSYIWIWILSETDYIKLSDGILNTIFIIQTLIGGFVGLLVASKMLSYKTNERIFKKIIPLIIFIEAVIAIYVWYNVTKM